MTTESIVTINILLLPAFKMVFMVVPVTESRSGSFKARKFYHAQRIDTNLMPQHMPDDKRNRETFSVSDMLSSLFYGSKEVLRKW